MSNRRWQYILDELSREVHRDGYYGRRTALENIVDELIDELKYVNLIQPTPTINKTGEK